jgi:hypothetical protein
MKKHVYQVGSQDPRLNWYGDICVPRVIDQLELLDRMGGERSLEREIRMVAEEMVRRLEGDDPVLFLAARPDYVRFLVEAPERLAREGRAFPETHLWLETPCGPKARHLVVFGNREPPWPEPSLSPPSGVLQARGPGPRPETADTQPSQPGRQDMESPPVAPPATAPVSGSSSALRPDLATEPPLNLVR